MRKTVQTIAVVTAVLGFAFRIQAADVNVWTSDVISDETDTGAVKVLKPVTLVGARNGAYSGKIVVESTSAIKGLKATVGALTGPGGVIPAANVQIRYVVAWDLPNWRRLDILVDSAPAVVPVQGRALLPVYVTVQVPKDTKAGMYNGEVTVQPDGATPVKVKVALDVADWTLPDPQDYRTFSDFVQSPDTLALEYDVPLWSEKHWELIARSFRLISPTGSRMLYVPLIERTNFGNEQSMVRWIKKGDKEYAYDYTVLEKYLDSAVKNLGKPKRVVFLVWDVCMTKNEKDMKNHFGGASGEEIQKSRENLFGKGPRVTVENPDMKTTGTEFLPRYEDAASKPLWQPMFDGIRKRMKERGLEDAMMLGVLTDAWPSKEEIGFWQEVSGGLPWASHGHAGTAKDLEKGNKIIYKIAELGYAAFVYNQIFNVNPDKGRLYGWKVPTLMSCYMRMCLNGESLAFIRELQAFNITGGQRGAGRIGADLWPAVRNRKGERAGQVYARYPENNWRNLDISEWFLAPDTDGPVATARLLSFMEGTQVCEARIVLEAALLDAGKKAQLGDDLAQRCQEALDAHHRAMWKTAWSTDEDLNSVGTVGNCRNPQESMYTALTKSGKKLPAFWSNEGSVLRRQEARKGLEQFAVGWQAREQVLFVLAGEVTAKLNTK